jgi:STE24 endopeptidase
MSEISIILAFYLFVKVSLDLSQIYTVRYATVDIDSIKLLEINQDDDKISRQYNIAKLNISIIKNITYVAWIYIILEGGLAMELNEYFNSGNFNTSLSNLFVILSLYLMISLNMLMFSFYSSFVIEEKYGFNTSTKLLFFKDNIISLVLSMLVISIVSLLFFYLFSFRDLWWLLMSFAVLFLIIMSIFIYPTYISPLFNKFQNLDDKAIKNKIEDLSVKTNFPINNLYVMDKSKRSKHPNAYFTGFKNNRRIVFFDTLLELLTPDEVKAVLAHEIGHYKHNHIIKSLILSTSVIFIGLFLLSSLVNSITYLDILNLPFNVSSQLIALIFTYQIAIFFIDPLFSSLSRKNEYEADLYAAHQVDKKYLISSLTKLYKSNLSFLVPNKLYALFYYSHPTVIERINKLRSNDERF